MKIRDMVSRHMVVPKYHLPVRRCVESDKIETWIFPLALVVLPARIIQSAFRAAWYDMYHALDLTEHMKRRR